MKNLISMTDFVLEQEIKIEIKSLTDQWSSRVSRYNKIISYANFLKQQLAIWQFVPCKLVDGVWVVLEKPKTKSYTCNQEGIRKANKDYDEYQQAKERCLFEGFEFTESQKYSIKNGIQNSVHWYTKNRLYLTTKKEDSYRSYFQLYTIEDLVQCDLQLTPTAQKQIGL